MSEIICENLYIVLLIPLWIFLILMIGRFFSVYANKILVYALTVLSSFLGCLTTGYLLLKLSADKIYDFSLPFIQIKDFIIPYGIHIDKLGLIFTFTLFLISFFVQIFSIFYMKNEDKQYRFYGLINLFNFSMAGLFLSPNLYQTYVFWELSSLVSYLLIGFEYFKKEKSLASKKVFIINRIGDTALIGAIILSSYTLYEFAFAKSFTALPIMDFNVITLLLSAYASKPVFILISLLFLIAIAVKSAQFPFYTWLQDAMEAKLPVSALLHSATLVAGGIYLGIRLIPLFSINIHIMKLISILGLLTALICSLSACVQNNPKKVLAYSTSAQMGLMFFALGMMNIKALVVFFFAHALIKSALFITLPEENKKWSYFGFIAFLLLGLSLSGLIFSGMIAKEMIAFNISETYIIILSIVSFLTAFYIFRISLRLADEHGLENKKPDVLEAIPVIFLLLLNILFYIYIRQKADYKIAELFWTALFGWGTVYILYIKNGFKKIPVMYDICQNGFYIDKFYTTFVTCLYSKFCKICDTIDHKIFGNYKPILYLSNMGVKITYFIEKYIMNKTVFLISNGVRFVSIQDSKFQTGDIRKYNLYAFIIITFIITCLIFGYSLIIFNTNGGFNG